MAYVNVRKVFVSSGVFNFGNKLEVILLFYGNEGSLTSTLRTLLFFTTLMITLPVGLYFSSKAYVFEGSLGMSDRDSYFYAAIVAVVTVHVVLALFVYVAWNEGSRQWREGKQD
ncbi:PREDICTED: vacuolar ATPase assembly integral membrane protein VMA21 [Corvus brachyrhynchos]|uniref:vacuolar ATPase assembly integral membrane protein VMA21 n=1 Tax=Corvus brachyrhynchos TaxID=85066 RepID=UPI000535169C|nr:PREDICTED: vacuolar ATPase assembly integral membrane protein VMA21 [Corvus brachyrhynchos]